MADRRSSVRQQAGRFSIRCDSVSAEAAYRDGWWVRDTLAARLRSIAAEAPERVLVVDGETRLMAGHLLVQAEALAHALLARAPTHSVVSFMLPNWHEAVVIYHAITLAGMVAHPIQPSLRDHELAFQLEDVGSRLIFIPEQFRRHDYAAMLDRVLPKLSSKPGVVVVRGTSPAVYDHVVYAELVESSAPAAAELPPTDPDNVRLVMYTSGTTGRSKGVLHTHNTLHALMRQIGSHWRVAEGDTFLVPSPISHIGGSIYAFEAPMLLGTRAVLMDRWDPEAALALAVSERCTHMCGATPFLEQLLDAAKRADEHLPTLKLFVCGGASVPPALIRNAATHFSHAGVTRVYGSTEVPVTTVGCADRDELAYAADTDGRPGIAALKLVPTTQAGDGDGEILVRGPQMLVGYLHAEDEASVFDDEGYYRTGDLGRLVEGKYLVVSGRSKDIIIRHGENIAPKEIEDLLLDHPQIAEIAIVGVPDPRTGERACAVIVPAAGETGPDVSALSAFLAARGVAAFKFPEEVAFYEGLPKNDAGKVLKHRIRAELVERQANARLEIRQ